VFLDVIWYYCQSSVIDQQFQNLGQELNDQLDNGEVKSEVIIAKHREMLRQICRLLFIDDAEFRKLMRRFIVDCNVLVEALSRTAGPDENISKDMENHFQEIIQVIEKQPHYSLDINLLLLKLKF
jgi:acetone carboxylase gamma subunit